MLTVDANGMSPQDIATALLRPGLVRDLGLCSLGAFAGLLLDGPMAYLVMQSICGAGLPSPVTILAVHTALLPFTSAIMLAVVGLCQLPVGAGGRLVDTLRDMTWADWGALALRTAIVYPVMMLSMSLSQRPFSLLLPFSAGSAALAGIVGMAGLIVSLQLLRRFVPRMWLPLPDCCA